MNNLLDIILFPLYVVFFALVFAIRRKRIKDPLLKKYHKQGFWIKVFSAFAFVIFSLFIANLDSTFLYYPEGVNIARLIIKDPANFKLLFIDGKDFDYAMLANTMNKGYFGSASNFFVARMVTVLYFFTFGSYSVITLVFSMISFSGVWRLFKFFYEQYPKLHKQLAIAIIYLPNFVFWSSGILKDPLCTGMLGWFTYSMYCAFIKKEGVVKNIFISVLSAWILGVVKAYILVSYLPFMLLFILFTHLGKIKSGVIRAVVIFFVTVFSAVGVLLMGDMLQNEMEELALTKLAESVQTSQKGFLRISEFAESSFSLGVEYDGTLPGLVKIAPAGIIATLYRPFLWESRKISSLMSSLESLAIMLFTLYVLFKTGPPFFFRSIFKDRMIMYCFSFALVFSLFVGVTTLNFGTLVRYKIPCIPFYIIAILLILERWKRITRKKAALASGDDQLDEIPLP